MNHYEFVDGELVITTTTHCDNAQVIRTACKPDAVFQKILHSFCESQDPSTVIEDEWHKAHSAYDPWLPVDEVFGQDESGNDITERTANGRALDERSALEAEHDWLPALRGEAGGERPVFDVEAFKAQWLLDNYQALRKCAYGPWEKQLEMQHEGAWVDHVAAVKARFPKGG